MKAYWYFSYNLVLALWAGGMAMFTLVVTPVIFKSYPRDLAGDIVGKLFPGYFLYTLVLAVLALLLFFLMAGDRSALPYRLSLVLLAAAVVITLYVRLRLYPETVQVKQQVQSFERESPDSPARKKFSRLHALSAALNLLLLADGTVLVLVSPLLKR